MDPSFVSQGVRLLTKEGEAEWMLDREDVCYKSQERLVSEWRESHSYNKMVDQVG